MVARRQRVIRPGGIGQTSQRHRREEQCGRIAAGHSERAWRGGDPAPRLRQERPLRAVPPVVSLRPHLQGCTGGGSVDQISGFSSFTSTTLASGCGGGTTGGDDPPPLVDPNSTGFAGESRAANHARLLDVRVAASSSHRCARCQSRQAGLPVLHLADDQWRTGNPACPVGGAGLQVSRMSASQRIRATPRRRGEGRRGGRVLFSFSPPRGEGAEGG